MFLHAISQHRCVQYKEYYISRNSGQNPGKSLPNIILFVTVKNTEKKYMLFVETARTVGQMFLFDVF